MLALVLEIGPLLQWTTASPLPYRIEGAVAAAIQADARHYSRARRAQFTALCRQVSALAALLLSSVVFGACKPRRASAACDSRTLLHAVRRVRSRTAPNAPALREKTRFDADGGPHSARSRLIALDRGLVFTTYSKIARRDGPEPAWGAFRGPIGVPCVTPPSRRPSSSEPSARGSGREKKLRGADGAAVGRVP